MYRCISLLLAAYVHAAKRLQIKGTEIIDPNTNQPITLHGVNWWGKLFQPNDGIDLKQDLPHTNVVRLVGLYWDNGNTDCRTNNLSQGYLDPKCI